MYAGLRSSNEGLHGYIKDGAHEALDDPGRRRVQGVAAQSFFVALLVMAANIRKIQSLLLWSETSENGGALRVVRRRRTKSISEWQPSVTPVTAREGPALPLIA
jgi:hypothetical protein